MNRAARDMLSSPWWTGAVFCLPAAVIALSGSVPMTNGWRSAIWAIGLGIMGTGCVINALRCGRWHCYFTGPFLLLMALLSVLYGLGAVPLGTQGWNWMGGVTICGAVLLSYLPERLFGKYRQR